MATLADFRGRFDEYAGASDALVQVNLDAAALRTPAKVWGDIEDEGVLWLAAYLLSLDPRARGMARAAGKDDENPYLRERRRQASSVASGYRTCGIPSGI